MRLNVVLAVVVKLFLGSGNYFQQKIITSTCGTPVYYTDKYEKKTSP
jgi:hypothetical protein